MFEFYSFLKKSLQRLCRVLTETINFSKSYVVKERLELLNRVSNGSDVLTGFSREKIIHWFFIVPRVRAQKIRSGAIKRQGVREVETFRPTYIGMSAKNK